MSTTTPTPTGRPNARMLQTVGDMARSIVVVLAVVAALLIFNHRASPDPIREVSITEPLIVANISADFPVLVPQGQRDYRLTSARWENTKPGVWHLGYVTPETTYVQLEQSATSDLSFISDQLTGTSNTGTRFINGDEWTTYAGSENSALVRTSDEVTTAVTGSAPMDELVKVAASLATSDPVQNS
ncbi:MAG: DUF4245 domain-containing protein [Actinomycetota bacterium]|nr:DUF4245 domain-containing protein [Actinomycetota bacterium]